MRVLTCPAKEILRLGWLFVFFSRFSFFVSPFGRIKIMHNLQINMSTVGPCQGDVGSLLGLLNLPDPAT